MINRVQLIKEMMKALDLPESSMFDTVPLWPLTASEILDPNGFDLKLGRQSFHFNLRNNPKLSEQISKVEVIPSKVRNEVITVIAEEKKMLARKLAAEARGEFTVNGVTFKMIRVDGGIFLMGSTSGEADEEPVHEVRVKSFSIGQTEVTQELWEAVMGNNPSLIKGKKNPVEQVSWDDCQMFIQKLNKLTGRKFRLPTEAEWEFAARGGTQSKGYTYSGSNKIEDVAWYVGNSDKITYEVASKYPNELGIYDMSGNVWEWCQDWYARDYYSYCVAINPTGPSSGYLRVNRGGSRGSYASGCRVSSRSGNPHEFEYNYVGFRLAL